MGGEGAWVLEERVHPGGGMKELFHSPCTLKTPSPALGWAQSPPAPTPHVRTRPPEGSPASGPARAPAHLGCWRWPAWSGSWVLRVWSGLWGFPAWSGRGLPATAAETAGAGDAAEVAGGAPGYPQGPEAACCTGLDGQAGAGLERRGGEGQRATIGS